MRLRVLVDAQEPMRFWHLNMTYLFKVKQGYFEIAILILHNFFICYYKRCLEACLELKYLHDSNTENSDATV